MWHDTLGYTSSALKAAGWLFITLNLLPCIYLLYNKNKFLQYFSKALIYTIDTFIYRLGEAVKWLLPLLVLTVAFTVFALSIFGQSWTKLFESVEYMHATVIMLGAGATLLAGQHVRVDILHTSMRPNARALVDFIGFYALLLPVCLVILWNSQSLVGFAWKILEASAESDGIKGVFLIKTLIPLFALTLIAQGLAIALRAAICLSGQTAPSRPPHTPQFFSEPYAANPASSAPKPASTTPQITATQSQP